MDFHKDPLKDFVRGNLIGLKTEITQSLNKANIGIKGIVSDETRNMIVIDTGSGEKSFPKDACTFTFTIKDGGRIEVEGRLLVSRPEDRIKKKQATW